MNPGQKRAKWYESIILISRKNFDSFWEDIFRKLFHMFFCQILAHLLTQSVIFFRIRLLIKGGKIYFHFEYKSNSK